jgi:serpin B
MATLFSFNIHADEIQNLISANNQLAFSLYHNINSSNCFFSPYSIETCFSLLYYGAQGSTKEEMKKALFFDIDKDKNLNDLQKIYSKECTIANCIWIDNLLNINPNYLKNMNNMDVELKKVSFFSPNIVQEINTWTSEKTAHKINNILSSADVDPYTKMVLVNTIYLKRAWSIPFNPMLTKDDLFYLTPTETKTMPMMQHTGGYAYFADENMQIVALPLKSDTMRLAMVMFLPKKNNLNEIFTLENFNHWTNELKYEKIIIIMPKFKMQNKYDLNPLMNMPISFSYNANFTGICDETLLYINKAIHQSYLNVDENGVEATAATAISMNATCCAEVELPIYFTANHPFAFTIMDMENKTILFMGTFDGK